MLWVVNTLAATISAGGTPTFAAAASPSTSAFLYAFRTGVLGLTEVQIVPELCEGLRGLNRIAFQVSQAVGHQQRIARMVGEELSDLHMERVGFQDPKDLIDADHLATADFPSWERVLSRG